MSAPTSAIILNAGRGRRLAPHTDDRPKGLIEVGGRSLLAHQVHRLAAAGVEHVLVVAGFRIADMQRACRGLAASAGIAVETVENPAFARSNTAASLLCALRGRQEGGYLLNGDTLFPVQLLHALRDAERDVGLAVEPGLCDEEAMKARVDDARRLRAISKQLDPRTALGEYIGVMRLSAAAVAPLRGALEDVVGRDPDAYYEAALQVLVDAVPMHAVPVDCPCIEIDFPADLRRAREEIIPQIVALERAAAP